LIFSGKPYRAPGKQWGGHAGASGYDGGPAGLMAGNYLNLYAGVTDEI
jgi:hypothetical protein